MIDARSLGRQNLRTCFRHGQCSLEVLDKFAATATEPAPTSIIVVKRGTGARKSYRRRGFKNDNDDNMKDECDRSSIAQR